MILYREGNRTKSYCDSCQVTYWSDENQAVKYIEVHPYGYPWIASICPRCISMYDLDIRFRFLQGLNTTEKSFNNKTNKIR